MSKCDNPTCWQCVQDEIEMLKKQLDIAEGVEDNLVASNERLRAFAENVRDNWGVLTGYELKDGAMRALEV